jgi:NodT family efflux transporter outer membrane factor (OMF) lipoprotein
MSAGTDLKKPPMVKKLLVSAVGTVCCLSLVGCLGLKDWPANGFKVGPNYAEPAAPVAERWIDDEDKRLHDEAIDHPEWWRVFKDPVLDNLISLATEQNLSLRVAGLRVLEARYQRAIAAGFLLPQQQEFFADFASIERSKNFRQQVNIVNRFFTRWDTGFNLAWELDFWGKYRRELESATAALEASAAEYGDVQVTLLADVASTYVRIRTLQKRLQVLHANAAEQNKLVEIVKERKELEPVDYYQLKANADKTLTQIPALETQLRQAENQLCILLGVAPHDLSKTLNSGPIPQAPPSVVVGMPGELLARRPDVRRAERLLAAQSAQIGVATSELYPRIAILGTIGLQANEFSQLWRLDSFAGNIGPSLSWNILNYGRIINNVRVQDARFQQLAAAFEQTALKANEEVENALVAYLKSFDRVRLLRSSAASAAKAAELLEEQRKAGIKNFSYNRLFVLQRSKTDEQDQAVLAEGEQTLALIEIYRSLGGGWDVSALPHSGFSSGCTADTRRERTVYVPRSASPAEGTAHENGLPPKDPPASTAAQAMPAVLPGRE